MNECGTKPGCQTFRTEDQESHSEFTKLMCTVFNCVAEASPGYDPVLCLQIKSRSLGSDCSIKNMFLLPAFTVGMIKV